VNGSTVAIVVVGVAAAGAGAYLLLRRKPGPAIPTGDTHSTSPSKGGLRDIEDKIGNALGLPPGVSASKIGDLANAAPTWLKVGVLPIGATAVAQTVINDPKRTAIKVGSAFKSAGKATAKAATGAVSAVGGSAKSVVSSISSLW
jgi:hypothetical protein